MTTNYTDLDDDADYEVPSLAFIFGLYLKAASLIVLAVICLGLTFYGGYLLNPTYQYWLLITGAVFVLAWSVYGLHSYLTWRKAIKAALAR